MTVNQIIEKFQSGSWIDKARKALINPGKAKKILFIVSTYLTKKSLRDVVDNIKVMYQYISEVIVGRYTEYDKTSVIIIFATLIYVISPLDVIPDIIPGIGYLDDATVISWGIKEFADEINRFKEWENKNKSKI